MTGALTLPAGTCLFTSSELFPLADGGVLSGLQLGFELWGAEQAPVLVVLGGISADCHVAAHAGNPRQGWWEKFVGPGRALDTDAFRVLAIDWLGGCGASSGGAGFPEVTSSDQARALALLLDHLRIERVAAFVGASFGGMVGLQFAALYPERVDQLVTLCAAHRSHPLASSWRAVQRRILALGDCTGAGQQALVLARALAMATYRSAAEFDQRFLSGAAAEEWLLRKGEEFAGRFTAEAFGRLSLAIDQHTVSPCAVGVPTTLVSFSTDQLVPPWLVAELAQGLAGPAQHVQVESRFGHDAFLKEVEVLAPILGQALAPARADVRQEVRS